MGCNTGEQANVGVGKCTQDKEVIEVGLLDVCGTLKTSPSNLDTWMRTLGEEIECAHITLCLATPTVLVLETQATLEVTQDMCREERDDLGQIPGTEFVIGETLEGSQLRLEVGDKGSECLEGFQMHPELSE